MAQNHSEPVGLAGRLRAHWPGCLRSWGPTQPLEVGRTSRVIHPTQRLALAGRDGGWVFPQLWPAAGLV